MQTHTRQCAEGTPKRSSISEKNAYRCRQRVYDEGRFSILGVFLFKHLLHNPCRRTFLKQLSALQLAAFLPQGGFAQTTGVSKVAVKNRAPLAPNAFYLFRLGAIEPGGWIRNQLQLQADSLGGHLDETWADVGPNSGWLGGTGESWERGPYFLDGLGPLAYLLDDPRLKAKAQKYIDWTLENQQPNGMIGPRSNDDWWPRMVMLKVLTQ